MGKEIFLLITVLLVAIIAILHFTPKKVYLNQSSELVLLSYFGRYKTIPLNEIESPESLASMPQKLVRVMGTRMGKRASGCFYSRMYQRKYYLFVTGNNKIVSFTYENKRYIVDSWMNE